MFIRSPDPFKNREEVGFDSLTALNDHGQNQMHTCTLFFSCTVVSMAISPLLSLLVSAFLSAGNAGGEGADHASADSQA